MTGDCACPVCGERFATAQGRGGHLAHSKDAAHHSHRLMQQVAAKMADRAAPAAPAAAAPAAPAPAPAPAALAPAPAPAPLARVEPMVVGWRPMARGLGYPWAAMSEPEPPAPKPAPAPQAPAPVAASVEVAGILKPLGAALLLGGVVAAACPNHRGAGFLVGAGLGVLVAWATEHQARPVAPAREAVPEVLRGIVVPGVWG